MCVLHFKAVLILKRWCKMMIVAGRMHLNHSIPWRMRVKLSCWQLYDWLYSLESLLHVARQQGFSWEVARSNGFGDVFWVDLLSATVSCGRAFFLVLARRLEIVSEVVPFERCMLFHVRHRHVSFGVSYVIFLSVVFIVFVYCLFSLNFPLEPSPKYIGIVID